MSYIADMIYGDDPASQNSGYGYIYCEVNSCSYTDYDGYIDITIKVRTYGTSSSSSWRGPHWSGITWQAGLTMWTSESGWHDTTWSDSFETFYYYDEIIDSTSLSRRVTKTKDVLIWW